MSEAKKDNILRMLLRGCSEREIASGLGLDQADVSFYLDEIRIELAANTSAQASKYFVDETLALYMEMEKTLWEEFNLAEIGSRERIMILQTIMKTRKENISLRDKLGKFVQEPKKVIENTILKELGENLRTTLSELALQDLENMEKALAPLPPAGKNIDLDPLPMLESAQILEGEFEED